MLIHLVREERKDRLETVVKVMLRSVFTPDDLTPKFEDLVSLRR